MIGGAPGGEERGPVSHKDQAVAYLQGEIKKAQEEVNSLKKKIERYTKPVPRRQFPQRPDSDGGGDIADYKLAVGEIREEENQREYWTSSEVEREIDHLEQNVHLLEINLHAIQDGDEDLAEEYYAEVQKAGK